MGEWGSGIWVRFNKKVCEEGGERVFSRFWEWFLGWFGGFVFWGRHERTEARRHGGGGRVLRGLRENWGWRIKNGGSKRDGPEPGGGAGTAGWEKREHATPLLVPR